MENETTTTIEERAAIQTAAKGWAIDPWQVLKGSRIVVQLPGEEPAEYEVANSMTGTNDRMVTIRLGDGHFKTIRATLGDEPDPDPEKDLVLPFSVVKGFAVLPEQEQKPKSKRSAKKAKPAPEAEAQPVPDPISVPTPPPEDKDPTDAGLSPEDEDDEEEQLEIAETLPTLEGARAIVARLREEHERELEAVDRARGPFEKAAKKFKAAKKRADTSWDALTEAKRRLGMVEGLGGR